MSHVPSCFLVPALALALCAPALATVTSSFSAGTLTIASDASDAIDLDCSGTGGNVLVNGAAPGSGAVACSAVTQLSVSGGPGANHIDLSSVNAGSFPSLASRTVDAGAGADTVLGSGGADVLIGGPDADTIDGNPGADIVFLGEGDDSFLWQPGDGSDTLEGQGGNDRLLFDGSAVSESITVSANGGRLVFFRDVGAITMDLDDVEIVQYSALGGSDTVSVNSLTGTDAAQLHLRLASTLGGTAGDGVADLVRILGGSGTDSLTADAVGGTITVTSGLTAVTIATLEPGLDNLTLDGGDGNDSVVVGAALAGQVATLTVEGGIGSDTLVARGGAAGDVLAVAATPPFVLSSGVALVDALAVENVRLEGLGGADTLSASGNLAALFALTLDGGIDDDTLSGGNGADVLLGGAGVDLLDGNQGADTLLAGEGDDVFQWDPGDGSDVLEGQEGIDTLRFNGSNVNESIALSANGARVLLTRDVAAIVLDGNDVEQIDLGVLGGTDSILVNDLASTDVTRVRALLAGTLGGTAGDAQLDSVTVNASSGADALAVSTAGGAARVTRGVLAVDVQAPDASVDRLVLNGLGGDDTITVTPAAAALLNLTLDGGTGSAQPGDIVSLAGESIAETYSIAPNAARVALTRSAPSAFSIDIAGTEWLQLALDGGADSVNTQGLPTTSQLLDGGAPGVVPGDSLNVAGFSGDALRSPIALSGRAPIVHTGFEQSTNQQVIEAFLSGAQETPRNPSTGRGYGTVTLNAAQDAILVFLEYSGLAGSNTLVHIHGPAPRGIAAAPIIDLPASGASSGTFSVGPLAITPTQRTQLKAGLWYFNVHSTAPGSAGGEIRGQLDGSLMRDGFE